MIYKLPRITLFELLAKFPTIELVTAGELFASGYVPEVIKSDVELFLGYTLSTVFA